jgi:hypothetical protein
MTGVPRTTVEDEFISGLSCAVCGQSDLYVQHLPSYPDFVTCRACGAAFVVEDSGERVMYGKVPDGYPDTSAFALRQWVWLEAVERRATGERPAPPISLPEAVLRSTMAEEPEADVEPEAPAEEAPAEETGPPADWLAARLMTSGMPAGVPIPTEPDPYRPGSQGVPLASDTGPTDESLPAWLRESAAPAVPRPAEVPRAAPAIAVAASSMPAASAAPMAAAAVPSSVGEGEPSPDQRHRVLIRGDRVRMPVNACAHCRKSPAPDRLPVPGSLPRPGGEAARRNTNFQVPLCRDCSRRVGSLSSEQRNARVMAVLVGALVGLVGVVAVLALGIIPFADSPLVGLLILGAIWFAAFVVTGGLMLGRASRAPRSPDADYVRTTLRVVADTSAPQTSFEWRNHHTALSFYQANGSSAVAEPSVVNEPTAA